MPLYYDTNWKGRNAKTCLIYQYKCWREYVCKYVWMIVIRDIRFKGAINRTFRTKCLCYAFPRVSDWFSVLFSYQDMYPIYQNNYFMIRNSIHNHSHVFEMLKRRAFRRTPDKKWRLLILKQKIDMGTIWCHLWLCTSKMFCSICVMLIRIKGNVQCLLENTNKKKKIALCVC